MHNKLWTIALILSSTILIGYGCNEAKFMQGKRTYDIMCGDCHMEDGSGVAQLYPQLTQENITTLKDDLPCIIRYGIDHSQSLIKMPPNPGLLPVDITNIINYMCNDLHPIDREYTMDEIIKVLDTCPQKNDTD